MKENRKRKKKKTPNDFSVPSILFHSFIPSFYSMSRWILYRKKERNKVWKEKRKKRKKERKKKEQEQK